MSDNMREYTTDDIVVEYDVERCIHVAECVRGLPAVFDTTRRPWVQPENAPADETARVILRCPTGALHFRRLDGGPEETVPEENRIRVAAAGPLYVRGDVEIRTSDGTALLHDTRVALCRCGASQHKPFCDNSHRDVGFADPGELGDRTPRGEVTGAGGPLQIELERDGPLVISGNVEIRSATGQAVRGREATLCRCGASRTKPFCDESHLTVGFEAE
jgi:CDGSH-type Zn-finger protein/uncharacterized Fe-S cluster protein YjdI